MVELFYTDDNGLPQITKEARTLQVFKDIIIADKGSEGDHDGRKKLMATKELAYVYWYTKFDTGFEKFDEFTRIAKVRDNVGLPSKWKPSDLVKKAVDFHFEYQRVKSMDYLESVQKSVDKLAKYLEQADPLETIQKGTRTGELVHDLNKIKNLAKEFPDLIESVQKARELVRKELKEEAQLRAGREINEWSE